jgi:uncharacterized protein (TIGR01777 family)
LVVVESFNFGKFWDQKLALVDNFSGKQRTTAAPKINSVAITGASGMVGSALKKSLESKNINVISITSNKNNILQNEQKNVILWDIENNFIDINKLEGVDAIIHLAGEGVASGDGPLAILGRWSDEKKSKILNSRVQGTKLIVDTISKLNNKPKVFISASAVGYYPYSNNENIIYDENSTNNNNPEGFLSNVCTKWENEALQATKYNVRTVCGRFGIILSSKGGLLQKLTPLFQIGGGGIIGSGRQGFSTVSLNDAVSALEFILNEPTLTGPVNICSPNPTDNEGFTKAFGR